MRKLTFFLLFFAALLTGACIDQSFPGLDEMDDQEDGPMVTLEFSLPPQTKGAMAYAPSISTIHVAVFNKAGVLKQYEEAVLTNPGNVTNGSTSSNPKYAVNIHMSSKPRVLHFIADAPITTFDALVAAAGTSGEDVILNALTTTGGQAAYWQRFVLDKVDAYTYQGGVFTLQDGSGKTIGEAGSNSYTYQVAGQTITVNKGDYIKRDGTKVLDGTGYFQSDYVKGVIANIPFVRNFAEITVTDVTGSNFHPKKFALVNVPTKGYVAPYDVAAHSFAKAYTASVAGSSFNGTLTYSGVHGTDYEGTLAGEINSDKPTSFIDLTASGRHAAYMYERPLPNTTQPSTCILVGGECSIPGANKDGNNLTWLLIEVDKDGTYFPFYRGLSYDVRIGTVEGTLGYASADAAYNAEPIGDISSSVTTATLEQINDGKGTTLWVEYIDYVAIAAETKDIYYTMYYENGGSITYLNNTVTASVSHPDASYKAILGNANTSDSNTYTTGTPSSDREWKKISVTLDAPGQSTKRSVLRIQGTSNAGKTMYRDVNYRVMSVQQFNYGDNELKGTILADESAGRETTLSIYLPSGLGYSMFPLTLRIEAEKENFTTSDGLPVEYGPSLFNSSKNAFYFLKTIEYEDYYNIATHATTNLFTATFKTTRDGSGVAGGTNATYFAVQDKVHEGRTAPYFEMATCYVAANSVHVTGVSLNKSTTRIQEGSSETLTATVSPSGATNQAVSWSSSNTSVATVSSSGVVTAIAPGHTTITVTTEEGGFTATCAVTVTGTVRFLTNSSTYSSNDAATTSIYKGDISLKFTRSFYTRTSTYVELLSSGDGFTLTGSEGALITSVIIQYTDYNHGAEDTSTASPASSSSSSAIWATSSSDPKGYWTHSGASTVSFSLDKYNSNYPQIEYIEVTYR